MFNDSVLTQIDLFVNGELTGAALAAFENEMAQDPDLRLEVSIVQDMAAGVRAHAQLKERLKRIDRETANEQVASEENTGQTKGKIRRLYFAVAAAAAIFLAIFALFNFPGEPLSPEQKFAMHYEVLPYNDTRKSETDKILSDATSAYKAKEYAKALELFNQLPANASFNLFKGISLIELERYDEAISMFDQVIEKDGEDTYDALWYKALTQLKKGDEAAMKTTLERLIKDTRTPGYLKKKAKSLLG